MTSPMKHWVDEIVSRQNIELAPGRAEKMARGVETLLAAAARDALLSKLPFDVDPTTYVLRLNGK